MKIACRVGWVPGLEFVWRLLMLGCDSSLIGGKNATSSPSVGIVQIPSAEVSSGQSLSFRPLNDRVFGG